MIIIKATNGDRLRLTPTRLTEIDHTSADEENGEDEPTKYPFHTTRTMLKEALEEEEMYPCQPQGSLYGESNLVEVRGRWDDGSAGLHTTRVPFDSERRRIGCKTFTKGTFNLILETMGLKK